jgi:alkanesulfonate monooxygenase SsuD/methylene tetrahydromethanopterin reductase-like flavin-dependent oxidoreductase (luciferase family)
MKVGLFLMPSHPPERSTWDAHQWDLDCLALADSLGFSEAWIGEHFTAPWEPVPAPDLLIAQALMRTENIKLGTGAHLLPFHNPVELAHRVAYLDHLAQGRYMFGIGSGGLLSDHDLFDVDFEGGEHHARTREALEIILGIWENIDGSFDYEGKFWNVHIPDPAEYEYATLKTFLRPLQQPHPPIGVAGASPNSETLKIVGERGYIPMSLGLNAVYVGSHWDAVKEGAQRAGTTPPSRSEWRIVRDVWVADTDDEAREGALNGMLGRAWRDYLHPLFSFGAYPFINYMKHSESIPNEDVTLEYLVDNLWIVGSPDTVARKLREMYEMVGGFGTLLWLTFDHSENREAYEKAMTLMANEVMPQLEDLTGE